MTDSKPLAVYDIRDGSYDYATHREFRTWCRREGIDVNITVRVEIHETREWKLFARVTEHERDTQGRLMLDANGTDVRTRTRDLPITCEPPQRPAPVAKTPKEAT